MTKGNQDFEVYAGDSKKLLVTVTEDDAPLDLTGAEISWYTTGKEIEKTSANGITVSDPLAGKFEVELSSEDTKKLAKGFHRHEAKVKDHRGYVATVFVGMVAVN